MARIIMYIETPAQGEYARFANVCDMLQVFVEARVIDSYFTLTLDEKPCIVDNRPDLEQLSKVVAAAQRFPSD